MANDSVNITGSSFEGNLVQGGNSGNIFASVSSSSKSKEENQSIAAEIQSILDDISKRNSGKGTTIQMQIATDTVQSIEGNQSLKQRIISALKSGGTAGIGQFLNHPAASFIIAVLEDWNS